MKTHSIIPAVPPLKAMSRRVCGTTLLLLLSALTFHLSTFAQGTAFTYQGQLKDGPGPANGRYDLTFSLFGVSSGGSAVGGPVINLATPVTNGLFTVLLDFGTGQFTGLERWLEIGVRTNGSGGFTTLTPRQPLTTSPYAIYAASAGTGGGSPWLLNGTNTFYNGGRVGIGTATPSTPLHIAADADPVMVLQDTGPASTQAGYVSFWNANPTETAWVGYGTPGSAHFSIVNVRSGGNIVLNTFFGPTLIATSSGRVGIGTDTPLAKLDVRGDIRLGASGQLRATSGEENLRIVRGTINASGGIVRGAGFTVVLVSSGDYEITFTTPFLSEPSVTATVDDEVASFEFDDFYVAGIFSPTTTSVRVRTRLHQGDFAGRISHKFHFCAIGPR